MTEAAALGAVPAEPVDGSDPLAGVDAAGSRLVEALSGLGWLPPAEWCVGVDADRLEQVAEIVRQSLTEDLAIARMRSETARESAAATRHQAAAALRRASVALEQSTRLAAAYRALIVGEASRQSEDDRPGARESDPTADRESIGSSAADLDGRRTLPRQLAELRLEVAQLQRALATRTLIGQATGVVMQALGCSPDLAWQALRALSQRTNTPVRELAASIVNQIGSGPVREIDALGPLVRQASGGCRPAASSTGRPTRACPESC